VLVNLVVNGEKRTADVPSSMTLVELLRERLGLTGTKVGCGRGDCGACTVLLDGEPANACLVFAAQRAFADAGAVQCGFCTPGMVMSTSAFLSRNPHPTRDEAAVGVSGNLCRCTGYVKIVDAVLRAAEIDSPEDTE
jgi:carbon-monoxide dehydrogenase small subunit